MWNPGLCPEPEKGHSEQLATLSKFCRLVSSTVPALFDDFDNGPMIIQGINIKDSWVKDI